MKKITLKIYAAAVFCLLFTSSLFANNIDVNNIALTNQNTSAGVNNANNHTHVKFDVTWENSWRVSSGPSNWDAAWVFVKYQQLGESFYRHATLSTISSDHTVTTDNGVAVTIQPSPDGKGVFMYRSNNGTGTINWQDVLLKWNYRADNVHDTADVTVKVFAIEMVYVPQGSFYLGDGNINYDPSTNAFRINNTPNINPKGREAYLVTSEAAITTVNYQSTALNSFYDPATFSSATRFSNYTLPAAYPKGFNAFYAMKYEVSQKAYVDFFNTLPTSPVADPSKGNRNLTQTLAAANARNNFFWTGQNLDNAELTRISTTNPGTGDRAQNWMSYYDAIAYADWAALRPMSEFEWEKAARGHDVNFGPIYPINGEFAWGNINNTRLTANTIQNDNTGSEGVSSSSNFNINAQGTVAIGSVTGNAYGPVRNGAFAAKNATADQRQQAGASYYGLMEMSGNVAEIVIAPYRANFYYNTAQGKFVSSFDGSIHGDGELGATGDANVANWDVLFPSSNYNASVAGDITPLIKGGAYNTTPISISTRENLVGTSMTYSLPGMALTRNGAYGFRAVRTAP